MSRLNRQSIGMQGMNRNRSVMEGEEGMPSDSDKLYEASKKDWQTERWDLT